MNSCKIYYFCFKIRLLFYHRPKIMDETPDWINNEFLEKALNSQEECSLKVVSSVITKATAPGDNYGSDIYRAIVQISKNGLREKKSLILKAELTNTELKKVRMALYSDKVSLCFHDCRNCCSDMSYGQFYH